MQLREWDDDEDDDDDDMEKENNDDDDVDLTEDNHFLTYSFEICIQF